LHVEPPRATHDIDQASAVDLATDDLRGEGDVIENVGERSRRFGVKTFLLDDVTAESDYGSFPHCWPPGVRRRGAVLPEGSRSAPLELVIKD
jgi:hypothetical protein